MAHIGSSDKAWANYSPPGPKEDLFHCESCDVEFALESDKIKNKHIVCPVCGKTLKAWQKEWDSNQSC